MYRAICGALAVLLACGSGCDPAKIGEFAERATKRVAKAGETVIAKLDTHESLAGVITSQIERMGETLAAMQDESSAKAQVGQFQAQAEELRGYVDRLRKLPALRDVEMAKRIRANYGERMKSCSRRYGEEARRVNGVPEMRAAVADSMAYLKDVMWDLQFAELDAIMREEKKLAAGQVTAAAQSPPRAPPPPPPADGAKSWEIEGRSPAGDPAKPGPGYAAAKRAHEESRERFERMREEARSRTDKLRVEKPMPLEGPDVLTIVVSGTPEGAYGKLTERARAIAGRTGYQAEMLEGVFTFRVRNSGDLQEVANKIDFGTVTSMDDVTRTIHVKH